MRKLPSLLTIKSYFWLMIFLTLSLFSGCQSPLDATNPFDPESNLETQESGQIVGQVQLPEYL